MHLQKTMESQAARRRMNTIAAHFSAADDPSPTFHLFPLNCSSSLSTPMRRYDNKMYFARQASSAQGYFMRQASTEQNCSSSLSTPMRRYDNKMYFARQASSAQGYFMRQASTEQSDVVDHRDCRSNHVDESARNASDLPLFSRPAAVEPRFSRPSKHEFNLPDVGVAESIVQGCQLTATAEQPKFARPTGITCKKKQSNCGSEMPASKANGTAWSPRMNIIESRNNYVITVELPGVDIKNIRVEVDDRSLTVTGQRSMKWSKVATRSGDSFSTFHKREIVQGSYQVVWPLPVGVNKDGVTAEFVEGMLQITIPKL